MNIKLNQKIIKEMCGPVSFKKGATFHRSDKVTYKNYRPGRYEATVSGIEDFHVTIEEKKNGEFQTNCSCPTLASFQKDCQHVAAVLLSICEHQRQGTTPDFERVHQSAVETNQSLTEELITIFSDQPVRSSGHQLHFEKRQVLEVEFTCKPFNIKQEQNMLGIEVKINQTEIRNIREFLKHVSKGNPCMLSESFKYDPNLQCFDKETDAVLQQLIQVIQDERMEIDELPDTSEYSYQQLLLIPPSTWDKLSVLLERAPLVKLQYDKKNYKGFHLSTESLSLKFHFNKIKEKGYQLEVHGLNSMIVLKAYSSVLSNGMIIKLKSEDFQRLFDLKHLLNTSRTNQISIPDEQINFFLEKVVPGLKKLGTVQIAENISVHSVKKPLIAKLFLDRLKNRLLAGLEFHYENIVINPLESQELRVGPLLIRDIEKEEAILQLLDDSNFAKTDGGYIMQNEELEYEFLYHVVPKLQKMVQIYATTAVKTRIFKGSAHPQLRIKLKKERTNWLEFKFEMDGIPEKHIQEILLALEEKRKFYRLPNGSLLSLETKEFKEMNRFLSALPDQCRDLESGLNVPIIRGLRLLDSVDDQKIFTFEESFLQFLQKLRNPESLEFEVPRNLELILRDYQKQGFQWLKTLASYGFGGILADDMGLGKTIQSITFIASVLPEIRKKKTPVLIICPSSLTYNWLSEIMKFAPDVQSIVIDGKKVERLKIINNLTDLDVVITSYPLLRKDINSFEKLAFHTVFFDEAQAFKNPLTQIARAVKRIDANNRFALTGTPIENSQVELWSIFHVVFPELFLGLKEYSQLSREAIARRTSPFLLRRLKEDVLFELPEKIESTEKVDLLPEQKKLYAAYLAKLKHETLKHLDKETLRKNRIKILAGLTRLRQICCHPALFVNGYKGTSAKFEQLLQIIEEAKLSGRRVLIFSQFTKMLKLIGRELTLQGTPFFYLDGQTPSEERIEVCRRFNKEERDFFLISLKAGGTGLNLTGADTVILYDLWWNPAVEQQAADRAHRIGQTNVVQVIKLVAEGTIEEKINELQEKKKHIIEDIINSDEKASSRLTEEDIREILMINS